MTNNISFLIGSGFSRPYGLPLAYEINERLMNVKHTDIWYGSAMHCGWLDGEEDLNAWSGMHEKVFLKSLFNNMSENTPQEMKTIDR